MAEEEINSRIEELKARLEADPGSRVFYQLGEELRKSEKPEEAEEILRKGLEQHPAYLSAWISLGRVLMDEERYQEAIEVLDKAFALDPQNVVVARLLGDSFARVGDNVEAIKKYKLVAALHPADEDVQARIKDLEEKLAAEGKLEGSEEPAQIPPPPPPSPEPTEEAAPPGEDEVSAPEGEEDVPPPPQPAPSAEPAEEAAPGPEEEQVVTPEDDAGEPAPSSEAPEPEEEASVEPGSLEAPPDEAAPEPDRPEGESLEPEPARVEESQPFTEAPEEEIEVSAPEPELQPEPGTESESEPEPEPSFPSTDQEEAVFSEASPESPVSQVGGDESEMDFSDAEEEEALFTEADTTAEEPPREEIIPPDALGSEPQGADAAMAESDDRGPFSVAGDEGVEPEAEQTEPGETPDAGGAEEGDVVATVTMGDLYARQGHVDQARAIYRKVLERDPQHDEARQRLNELDSGTEPAEAGESEQEALPEQTKIRRLEDWLAKINR